MLRGRHPCRPGGVHRARLERRSHDRHDQGKGDCPKPLAGDRDGHGHLRGHRLPALPFHHARRLPGAGRSHLVGREPQAGLARDHARAGRRAGGRARPAHQERLHPPHLGDRRALHPVGIAGLHRRLRHARPQAEGHVRHGRHVRARAHGRAHLPGGAEHPAADQRGRHRRPFRGRRTPHRLGGLHPGDVARSGREQARQLRQERGQAADHGPGHHDLPGHHAGLELYDRRGELHPQPLQHQRRGGADQGRAADGHHHPPGRDTRPGPRAGQGKGQGLHDPRHQAGGPGRPGVGDTHAHHRREPAAPPRGGRQADRRRDHQNRSHDDPAREDGAGRRDRAQGGSDQEPEEPPGREAAPRACRSAQAGRIVCVFHGIQHLPGGRDRAGHDPQDQQPRRGPRGGRRRDRLRPGVLPLHRRPLCRP
ncbi:MAG: hypothetical protein BWZ01_02329 [Deltaproteobacteria bacterium ADurb.BinA179]|nr:MAG: hypothetical protein BWZ01_02329 [Deltaproteobacteria bacterium ADurb.BinA179]